MLATVVSCWRLWTRESQAKSDGDDLRTKGSELAWSRRGWLLVTGGALELRARPGSLGWRREVRWTGRASLVCVTTHDLTLSIRRSTLLLVGGGVLEVPLTWGASSASKSGQKGGW